jgi:hypothetical protein
LDFSPAVTEVLLMDASVKYYELTGQNTHLTMAYEVWFTLQHPDIWAHTSKGVQVLQARNDFGHLSRVEFLTMMGQSLSSHPLLASLVSQGRQP